MYHYAYYEEINYVVFNEFLSVNDWISIKKNETLICFDNKRLYLEIKEC